MKRRTTALVLFIILLISNIFLFSRYQYHTSRFRSATRNQLNYKEFSGNLTEEILFCLQFDMMHSGIALKNYSLEGIKGASLLLHDLTKKGYNRIIYFSDNHCSSCIENLIFRLRKKISTTEDSGVFIVIWSDSSRRKHWDRLKILLPEINYYFVNEPLEESLFSDVHQPLLLTCTEDLIIYNAIPVINGTETITNKFLEFSSITQSK